MKIVAISDTHRFRVPNLPKADVLVHAGDWSTSGKESETDEFLAWMKDIRSDYSRILVGPGNHDRHVQDFQAENAIKFAMANVDLLIDQEVSVDGVKFYFSPWTPTFGRWSYMCDEATLRAKFACIPSDIKVLVTHGPPKGFLDEVEEYYSGALTGRHAGSSALLDALERVKPKIHVFGHIHEGYGQDKYGNDIQLVNASIMDRRYQPNNTYHVLEIL